MMRSTMNLASALLAGIVFSLAVISFGFFASPEAVRTSPPAAYNSLLLIQFESR